MTDNQLTITRAMLAAALRDSALTVTGAGSDLQVWDALNSRARAGLPKVSSRARQPWEDELNRLRWVEEQTLAVIRDLREDARTLRETITPAADDQARDSLDARAAELDGAAERIQGVLDASRAGTEPTSRQWAQWHVDQLTYHLGVLHGGNGAGR
jgi:hypothetical protein